MKLQLQFYFKTHKETNTEKSDYTLADDELWTNQVITSVMLVVRDPIWCHLSPRYAIK